MLQLGSIACLTGNITTLNWIGPRPPRAIEESLGFGVGRLMQGYYIALLIQPLKSADFELDGTTLRSGGRLGAPAATFADDQLRLRVRDEIKAKYGSNGYEDVKRAALRTARIKGEYRLAKVIPNTPHSKSLAPNLQYPMGGGGLQWAIVPPGKNFLIALYVDPSGMADSGTFRVSLAESQSSQQLYTARHKVSRYLATA